MFNEVVSQSRDACPQASVTSDRHSVLHRTAVPTFVFSVLSGFGVLSASVVSPEELELAKPRLEASLSGNNLTIG